jgi:hypothetical protein
MSLPDNDELKVFHTAVEGQQASPGPCNPECQWPRELIKGGVAEPTHLQLASTRQTRPANKAVNANEEVNISMNFSAGDMNGRYFGRTQLWLSIYLTPHALRSA